MDKSHVEAWKAVTEFTKVIISLSTSVLTLLVGYMTVNWIPPFLLVVSIIFSIYGFGRAIPAIKTGDQQPASLLYSNLSAFALTLGIMTVPFISIEKNQTIDNVLHIVEQETQSLNHELSPKNCKEVTLQDDLYVLKYPQKEKTMIVKYSVKSKSILLVKEESKTQ
jgi:hypothetical protein